MPDISYDLDGDGYVGGRDYVLSKKFDLDGDGKLNSSERKAADDAIRNVSYLHLKHFRESKSSLYGILSKQVLSVHLESCKGEVL